VIQGLISLEFKFDHVYLQLVESAPFNKGKSKVYAGVPGTLLLLPAVFHFKEVSKAMYLSFQKHN
jgi:hypothetical protein